MNAWNLIGLGAWVLLAIYLIFVIFNIRNRHIKMVITRQTEWRHRNHLLDTLEVIVLLAAIVGMGWVSFFRQVDYADEATVSRSYSYAPLVLQVNTNRSYYVTARSGNGNHPVKYFSYWREGAKYAITSRNATISDGTDPLNVQAAGYPWSLKKLKKLDKTEEKAWIATFTATYTPTFLNGLGMHVGHVAQRYSIIRIPNDTFLRVLPRGE
ncbi:LVIS_2131 family protein [Lacticaseibacillus yichunensis]|uniref:LVIS_2131 family protein n=1 Tax=Lacticaseibacillus yichunensis TaxID=2486015 RepID=A0ABW4CUY5_9LACO|nr:LVIS_2131 family protein [Lacticaseibacillus yichunensis]